MKALSLFSWTAIGALMFATAALAEGNSVPGADRYNSNPGKLEANTHVGPGCDRTASGAGAFGFFGKDLNLGIIYYPEDDAKGADGHQTGINNSSLCGERQGNLP